MSRPSDESVSNPYLSDPDVLLFLEFQKGKKSSFETLMHKYYKRILNFNYRFVGNAAIAEDLAQEIFIRAYQNVSSYSPKAKFQTWLYTIAHHLCLNELRRLKRKVVSIEENIEVEDSTVTRQIEDEHSPSPDREVLEQEKRQAIKEAIDLLPENQRTAVLLRRYEDMSYEEIAKAMRCSPEAVKSLLNRAKEGLKVHLSRWLRDEKIQK